MNCKPGDTAILVRADADPCYRALIGRAIVTVTIPIFEAAGPVWDLKEPLACPLSTTRLCRIVALPDAWLTPLRGDEGEHPGDKLVKLDEQSTMPPAVTTP